MLTPKTEQQIIFPYVKGVFGDCVEEKLTRILDLLQDLCRDGRGNFYCQFATSDWELVQQSLLPQLPLAIALDTNGSWDSSPVAPSKYQGLVCLVVHGVRSEYAPDDVLMEIVKRKGKALGVHLGTLILAFVSRNEMGSLYVGCHGRL